MLLVDCDAALVASLRSSDAVALVPSSDKAALDETSNSTKFQSDFFRTFNMRRTLECLYMHPFIDCALMILLSKGDRKMVNQCLASQWTVSSITTFMVMTRWEGEKPSIMRDLRGWSSQTLPLKSELYTHALARMFISNNHHEAYLCRISTNIYIYIYSMVYQSTNVLKHVMPLILAMVGAHYWTSRSWPLPCHRQTLHSFPECTALVSCT